MSMKIKKTNWWLDGLTYIFIPLYLLIGAYRLIGALMIGGFTNTSLLFLSLEGVGILLGAYTWYHLYKRTKDGYFFIRFFIVVTAILSAVTTAANSNYNDEHNFLLVFAGYFALLALVWIYPNELYFKARKHLFKNREKTVDKPIFGDKTKEENPKEK